MFRIQVQSAMGGYLSTAATTKVPAYVDALAKRQADIFTTWKEARQPYFADGILRVWGDDGKVVSTYTWSPTEGTWSYSSGSRISTLEK